jgi:hypothetical protein
MKLPPTMVLRRTAAVVVAIAALVGLADAFSSTAITPNTKLPAVNLHYGFPPVLVNLAPYAGGKTMIIVGLPGAVRLFWAVMRCHFPISFWYSFSRHSPILLVIVVPSYCSSHQRAY